MAEVYSYTFVRDVHYFSVKAEGRVFQNALLLRQAFPARAQVFREKSPLRRVFFLIPSSQSPMHAMDAMGD